MFRGREDGTARPVIVKLLRDSSATAPRLGRLRLEYDLLEQLACDGVVRAIEYLRHKGRHALILEDLGGSSLDMHVRNGTWKPPHSREELMRFLRIAESLAGALARVHESRIIHKDIKPHNIVWNEQSGIVKLIDFDIATLVASEAPELVNPHAFEGTIEYMSPEQTGRMNRPVDCRSDLYSLGVTFFQLLTGQVPFSAGDALELLHAHMAKVAPPVASLNPDVPGTLSAIVGKLMAKAPEDRYQSAFGLAHDLRTCRQAMEATGTIAELTLGESDASLSFRIGSTLYGREEATRELLDCFAEMATEKTGSAMAVVSGYSGIGKSAIINELHKPLTEQRGLFISGKFDQFKRNVPYSSLIQAFQGLIRLLLTVPDERIAEWKQKIVSAVRPNGQVLLDVMPELVQIIGPQAPLAPLGAIENQNRFERTLCDFCA
ncbi:MAG TPA: AAA family ATPase, partial [Labilithrix sp.]|nr:AAA family ATPase [Labilithrix sp.]